ncbi:preprotein translocase subunit SecY [Ignavigranum ruoffiae]|uniref:Protein translocase subunit SecY n=1 Tax=Ignavigranum ruoffiae TaxID=89093 RepID=A0A1H9D671_9LACT|nr:preprotein translocase subunit SecY [Ignavigranum ruoffiae]UPQ86178.1 preprotein translocase subunit SecY [Ignavigranum ruoffiae]SEQ08934.1 protein translocase subunit secY/sec61 alpha [Ignavigranum ruoffiae]
MFTFIKNAFTTRDIRRRILFTLFIFAVFRLGVHIPVPGVNAEALKTIADSGILGLLNTFGGGALKRFSLFAMGVSPYITASIIMQLLQMDLVPKFTEWSKQGEVGRRKLNQASTYLAIIMGFFQSLGLAYGFNQLSGLGLIANPTATTFVTIALVLTAGTMLLVWMGEQITRNGIGNGVSMIIFAGIVSEVPKDIYQYVQTSLVGAGDKFTQNLLILLGILLILVLAIIMVVLVERAQRRIPIHHSKRASGAKYMAHLPLKINSAGVIPVIFASSFITTPQQIFSFMDMSNKHWIIREIVKVFDLRHPYGAIFYTLLLIAFTYFYALIQVNPEKVAENLQKQSGYIPSVRPGNDTESYLTTILNRLSGVGAIYLVIIAVAPIVVGFFIDVPMTLSLSGTSLLIVVGVAIETAKQVEGRMVKRRYKGFLNLQN